MTIYYVCASTGSNSNVGSQSSPFLTIQYASVIATAGDTIIVQPGIYRERVAPYNTGTAANPITYLSAVKGEAIIRGSIPWQPSSQLSCNIWQGDIYDSSFTDISAIDGANPFKVPVSVTPYGRNGRPEAALKMPNSDPNLIYSIGQVFVDGQLLLQCPYFSEMQNTPNSWTFDPSINKLSINLPDNDPTAHLIEITNQRRVFAPHQRGLRYIVVDGFTIEHCGNNYPNQFWTIPQNQHAGMIGTRSGRYWTIQNNTIRFANGIGIEWGNEGAQNQDLEKGVNGPATGSYGHIIKNNIITDNGAAGTAAYLSKNFTFSNNIVKRNNNLLFTGQRRWESAGVKVHQPTNSIIQNNIIENNYCHGIWSDQGAGQNSIFQNNILRYNTGSGINYEIGSATTGNVLNNIFYMNNYGVSFATSGGVTIANNAFLGSTVADIYTNIFTRTADKWDSNNISIQNNLFLSTTNPYHLLSQPDTTVPSSRFLNNNIYVINTGFSILPPINSKPAPKTYTMEQWQIQWAAINGSESNSLVLQNSFLYDPSANILTLNIENVPVYAQVNQSNTPRTNIDYYGNFFQKSIAGPFASLKTGKNVFQL
jgi:hypothetical protein